MIEEVEVWRPGDQDEPGIIAGMGDTLEGDDVLPGFSMTVAQVFARA